MKVRSDHRGEFENEPFEIFCEKHGIFHEFSSPRTPQQNGVVERKNRSLQEMARTMIHENNLGYSERSKAYRLYNSETLYVEESMHVRFDDKEPGDKTPEQDENFAGSEESDDDSEPNQISELNDTSEAVTAPEIP